MKTCKFLALLALLALSAPFTRAAVVSTTVHGTGAFDLDPSIALGDLLSGRLGTELPPLNGWHPANTDPADQLPAMTDDAGLRASGLTGLLNDFPGTGTPAKTLRYSFAPTDIARIQILSGNAGGDGRVFSTTVIRYSIDGGGTFSPLGYFQSDPSGFVNPGLYRSTLVSISDDSSPVLRPAVTDLIFELYAVDNTGAQMRDPFDGVNPFTGADDGLSAAFVSPLIWELDVIAVPEPSTLSLLLLALLAWSARSFRKSH